MFENCEIFAGFSIERLNGCFVGNWLQFNAFCLHHFYPAWLATIQCHLLTPFASPSTTILIPHYLRYKRAKTSQSAIQGTQTSNLFESGTFFGRASKNPHAHTFSPLFIMFEVWVSCEALWDTFNRFCCLIWKWNSTLCQIYWIPDLESLKLVCFMVANIWKRKYADFWLFWWHKIAIFDRYLIEDDYV